VSRPPPNHAPPRGPKREGAGAENSGAPQFTGEPQWPQSRDATACGRRQPKGAISTTNRRGVRGGGAGGGGGGGFLSFFFFVFFCLGGGGGVSPRDRPTGIGQNRCAKVGRRLRNPMRTPVAGRFGWSTRTSPNICRVGAYNNPPKKSPQACLLNRATRQINKLQGAWIEREGMPWCR